MRQINILMPDNQVKKVLDIARKSELNAAHVRSAGPFDLVIITVPDEDVNLFITKLKRADIDKLGTVSILPIHASLSDTEVEKVPTIAPKEEIIESARRATYLTRGYIFMIIISAFVVTLGLLMNSTAVVIGAMVIAPLLGPSIAASVGTVMGDTALFRKGIVSTTLGLTIVIIAAAITAAFVNAIQLLPPVVDINIEELPSEMAERTTLNILIVGLALASGAAGAYSFAEKKGEILVGVMIAVALVPPAAIVGIGLALLDVDFIIHSGLLLAVNVFCINIAGTLVFWKLGIRPAGFRKMVFSSRDLKKRLGVTLVILLVLGAILSWTTWITYQNYQLEKDIREEAMGVITDVRDNQNISSIIDFWVDEVQLGRGIFDLEYTRIVTVGITIQSNNISQCTDLNISSQILSALQTRFPDDIKKGFEIQIIFQEVEVSR
jgi:uncharacterized hydrophobic protein (TIGR00341 family)